MRNGFLKAEQLFLKTAEANNDKSGSCAIVVIISGSKCYIANTGDSRVIMSSNKGKMVIQLSKDHKPNEVLEKTRILANGGSIYSQHKNIYRIAPGTLSVSRTFGDLQAKVPKYGGKENVVIANPDIVKFNIESFHDFLIIGSDGLFDKLRNQEIVKVAWDSKLCAKGITRHKMAGRIINSILESAIYNKSTDNITAIIICFEGLFGNECIQGKARLHKLPGSNRIKRVQSTHNKSNKMKLLDKSVF